MDGSQSFSGEDIKPSSLPLMHRGATAMSAPQPQQNGSAPRSPVVQPLYSHFLIVVHVTLWVFGEGEIIWSRGRASAGFPLRCT